ncbi:hypothetical protein ACFWMG_40680 [Streptomyces sp. NPDC127074]|uniref:hypothetical protein n=1 Tax=Streptomyces sp. NPDC127074 TaxID=3347130 RepID=UPI00364754AB
MNAGKRIILAAIVAVLAVALKLGGPTYAEGKSTEMSATAISWVHHQLAVTGDHLPDNKCC